MIAEKFLYKIPRIELEVNYELPDWATNYDALKEMRKEMARLYKIEKKLRADEIAARQPRKERVALGVHISYYDDGYGHMNEITEYEIFIKD